MTPDGALLVSTDNFTRAESDLFFSRIAADGGFGTFSHHRDLTPLDDQLVVRLNRDTLYSAAVFDLDAAPVTISLPDPGDRFMSMQIITEDQFVPTVVYGAGTHTFRREDIRTRYVLVGIRTFVDPNDPADLRLVHLLQMASRSNRTAPAHSRYPRGTRSVKPRCGVRSSNWPPHCPTPGACSEPRRTPTPSEG